MVDPSQAIATLSRKIFWTKMAQAVLTFVLISFVFLGKQQIDLGLLKIVFGCLLLSLCLQRFRNKLHLLGTQEIAEEERAQIDLALEHLGESLPSTIVFRGYPESDTGQASFCGDPTEQVIILNSAIIKTRTPDELAAIIAHEWGHWKDLPMADHTLYTPISILFLYLGDTHSFIQIGAILIWHWGMTLLIEHEREFKEFRADAFAASVADPATLSNMLIYFQGAKKTKDALRKEASTHKCIGERLYRRSMRRISHACVHIGLFGMMGLITAPLSLPATIYILGHIPFHLRNRTHPPIDQRIARLRSYSTSSS